MSPKTHQTSKTNPFKPSALTALTLALACAAGAWSTTAAAARFELPDCTDPAVCKHYDGAVSRFYVPNAWMHANRSAGYDGSYGWSGMAASYADRTVVVDSTANLGALTGALIGRLSTRKPKTSEISGNAVYVNTGFKTEALHLSTKVEGDVSYAYDHAAVIAGAFVDGSEKLLGNRAFVESSLVKVGNIFGANKASFTADTYAAPNVVSGNKVRINDAVVEKGAGIPVNPRIVGGMIGSWDVSRKSNGYFVDGPMLENAHPAVVEKNTVSITASDVTASLLAGSWWNEVSGTSDKLPEMIGDGNGVTVSENSTLRATAGAYLAGAYGFSHNVDDRHGRPSGLFRSFVHVSDSTLDASGGAGKGYFIIYGGTYGSNIAESSVRLTNVDFTAATENQTVAYVRGAFSVIRAVTFDLKDYAPSREASLLLNLRTTGNTVELDGVTAEKGRLYTITGAETNAWTH